LKTYIPQKPCKRGHKLRYTSSKACVQCLLEWKAKNRALIRDRARQFYEANAEEMRLRKRQQYEADREGRKQINRAWRVKNPGKSNAITAKRHAQKLRATPAWLTAADYDRIAAIYTEAARLTRETGVVHHVDHVIPLQGKTVSGLHAPDNLQILTATDNHKKNNKLLELH